MRNLWAEFKRQFNVNDWFRFMVLWMLGGWIGGLMSAVVGGTMGTLHSWSYQIIVTIIVLVMFVRGRK